MYVFLSILRFLCRVKFQPEMLSEEKPFKVLKWHYICICKMWDRNHCLPAHKCLYGFNSGHIHLWILFLHTCKDTCTTICQDNSISLKSVSSCTVYGFGFVLILLDFFYWDLTSKEIHRWTVISDSPLVSSFSLSSSSMSNSDSLSSYSTFSSSSLKSGANALQFSYHHIR